MVTPKKIPVYSIQNVQTAPLQRSDFQVERLVTYLDRHYEDKHTPHRHSFYHMVLFTAGKGTYTIDFNRFSVKPFQVYSMIPGQVHSWHFEGGVTGFVFNFSDTFFKNFLFNQFYLDLFSFFSGLVEDSVFQLPAAIHKKVAEVFEEMAQKALAGITQEDMVRVLALQLFLLMNGSLVKKESGAIPEQKKLLLQNLRGLIDAHYKTIRLPKEYADLLYITPNHLNALCQDLLGMTAGELIRNRVLLEAKRLLTNVKMTVAEVAYELNFQDNSYFSRFFKKYEGVTPDEFRKQFLK